MLALIACLLEAQDAHPDRVNDYRMGAKECVTYYSD